jgi:predicted nucleic acid-binding protein
VNFLLDTNVVSEWVKPRPDPGVVAWLTDADEDHVFLSVVTLAELRYGVARLADGARRRRLDAWLRDELASRFEGRIIAIDDKIADAWGGLVAASEAAGRPIGAMDALIAATALTREFTVVTRDAGDFELAAIPVMNPWAR